MEDTQKLLDLAYEIEGLLCLKKERAGDVPSEVNELLRSKIGELYGLYGSAEVPEAEEELMEQVPEIEQSGSQVEVQEEPKAEDAEIELEEEVPEIKSEESELAPELPEPPESTEEPAAEASPKKMDLLGQLSLNDKFRFRRELFGNSDTAFQDALDTLELMTNSDEVEDYLYNDLCFDADNEEVKAFMELIRHNFEK